MSFGVLTAVLPSALIDALAREIEETSDGVERVPIECPLQHTFTPGLYTRTIFMPASARIISHIHLTRHPFFVSKGRCKVVYPDGTVTEIIAPYMGITEAGTQRALQIDEDTVWTTVHANPDDERDVEKIADRILYRYELPAGDHMKLETTGGAP